jgi:hypothetical protein
LALSVVLATPARAQHWELTLVSQGDSVYTDLRRIERVAPRVYRAWSRYVYLKPHDAETAAEALVQKEYDCGRGTRRVLSAVFYDADRTVTWESKEPGPSTPATRKKGRRQWSQVCDRVEGGRLAYLVAWIRVTMRGPIS